MREPERFRSLCLRQSSCRDDKNELSVFLGDRSDPVSQQLELPRGVETCGDIKQAVRWNAWLTLVLLQLIVELGSLPAQVSGHVSFRTSHQGRRDPVDAFEVHAVDLGSEVVVHRCDDLVALDSFPPHAASERPIQTRPKSEHQQSERELPLLALLSHRHQGRQDTILRIEVVLRIGEKKQYIDRLLELREIALAIERVSISTYGLGYCN